MHRIEGVRGSMPTTAVWAVAGAIGLVGFVLAPQLVMGDPYDAGVVGGGRLPDAAGAAIGDFLSRHSGAVSGPAAQLSHYWAEYHTVKLLFAVVAAIALAALAAQTFRWASEALVRRDLVTRSLVGGGVTAGAIGAVLLVAANVQGAWAPLSSALSLLPADAPPTRAAAADAIVRGTTDPALSALEADFGRYHAVLAACMVVITLVCASVAVLASRVRRRAARGTSARVVAGITTGGFVLVTLVLGVVLAANVGTALDPGPALVGFLST